VQLLHPWTLGLTQSVNRLTFGNKGLHQLLMSPKIGSKVLPPYNFYSLFC
jgi:hypothetical protein